MFQMFQKKWQVFSVYSSGWSIKLGEPTTHKKAIKTVRYVAKRRSQEIPMVTAQVGMEHIDTKEVEGIQLMDCSNIKTWSWPSNESILNSCGISA